MTPAELKEARLALGLTTQAWADLLKLNARTIRAWENGGSNARPAPYMIELLLSLAIKFPSVAKELKHAAKASPPAKT